MSNSQKIKSDGGSSSYYEIDIPASKIKFVGDADEYGMRPFCRIEVKDVIKYALDNDFDKGNIFKALVRLGKKEGADEMYDLTKCKFFIEELKKDYE